MLSHFVYIAKMHIFNVNDMKNERLHTMWCKNERSVRIEGTVYTQTLKL